MMKRITVTISEVTEAKLKEKKPEYLSLSKYINMILESSLDNLDSLVRLPAYRVGAEEISNHIDNKTSCLLYTSPSPRDMRRSRMPSSA